MIKVKICGITRKEDALLASGLGADALGFIFVNYSPRRLTLVQAKRIISALDPFIVKVGVFADENKKLVMNYALDLGLDALQFHGHETPDYCNFFRPKFKVIKVFFPQDMPYRAAVKNYKVDAYLFDVKYEEKKRGDKKLSSVSRREISDLIKRGLPTIISGGINSDNVKPLVRLGPYGVDVARGVERDCGIKSRSKMSSFIKTVKGL